MGNELFLFDDVDNLRINSKLRNFFKILFAVFSFCVVSELAAETIKIGNTFVRSSWTDTETDKNGKKEALHIVICVSETIVKGKFFGENCERKSSLNSQATN